MTQAQQIPKQIRTNLHDCLFISRKMKELLPEIIQQMTLHCHKYAANTCHRRTHHFGRINQHGASKESYLL